MLVCCSEQGYKLKTYYIVLVACARPEPTRNIDAEFLRTVSRFEFTGDFQRQDGIFERIRLDNLHVADELDLCGDWVFEVNGPTDLTKKLLAL